MLNARLVNGGSSYFSPATFCESLPFFARFHDFKIRLNIRASFELTNLGRLPAQTHLHSMTYLALLALNEPVKDLCYNCIQSKRRHETG